ncbi:MAG: septum formation initiator family protein [Candidatus Saccharibacteria bacterium]
MDFDSILKSKTTSLLLGGLLVLIMIVTAKLVVQKYQVDKEIKQLQRQAADINSQNLELGELSKYLNTPEYAERQAREKLNLKREGEYVVGLPNQGDANGAGQSGGESRSNFRLWLDYFFKKEA